MGAKGGGLMAQTETEIVQGIGSDYAIKYGFNVPEDYFFKSGRGLSHELIDAISSHKNEPDWMRKFRHESLENFLRRPLPTWGGDLTGIDFDHIFYYIRPTEKQAESWEDLPADIRINAEIMGQFERTLMLVDEEAYVHYVVGCAAPIDSSDSLHSAVVEIVVKKGGRCRYTTIQNWSNNVYNLVTKRAMAYE